MSSDELVWFDVDAAGGQDELARSILQGVAIEARAGRWAQLTSITEERAQALSEKMPVPIVHCVIHTAASMAWIHVFVAGRCVRELLSTGDGDWETAGKALPFENRNALAAMARRRRAGKSVDPYDLIDAFLGREVVSEAPIPKPKKPVVPRRRARAGVVVIPGPEGDPLADEDRFKPPASWALSIDRRRGGWFREAPIAVRVEVAFAQAQASFESSSWTRFPISPRTQAAEAGQPIAVVRARFVAGAERALLSVAEEAATAVVFRPMYDVLKDGRPPDSPLVSFWVGAGGLPFAVECAVAALDAPPAQRNANTVGPGLAVLRTLRRFLAAATDADYVAAREHCAGLRGTAPHVPNRAGCVADLRKRIVTSYLFPTETEWTFDMLAALAETPAHPELAALVLACRRTSPFDASMTIGAEGLVHLPAMVEAFGRGFEEHLEREVLYLANRNVDLTLLGEALASIPTDRAMLALQRCKHVKGLDAHLAVATASYPLRAARLGLA
jgi:hypothetical protein